MLMSLTTCYVCASAIIFVYIVMYCTNFFQYIMVNVHKREQNEWKTLRIYRKPVSHNSTMPLRWHLYFFFLLSMDNRDSVGFHSFIHASIHSFVVLCGMGALMAYVLTFKYIRDEIETKQKSSFRFGAPTLISILTKSSSILFICCWDKNADFFLFISFFSESRREDCRFKYTTVLSFNVCLLFATRDSPRIQMTTAMAMPMR